MWSTSGTLSVISGDFLTFLFQWIAAKFRFEIVQVVNVWFEINSTLHNHYNDVTMSAMASQITSLTIVYSTVYSGAYQRKHQSSASLAFAGNSPVTNNSQRCDFILNIFWRTDIYGGGGGGGCSLLEYLPKNEDQSHITGKYQALELGLMDNTIQ